MATVSTFTVSNATILKDICWINVEGNPPPLIRHPTPNYRNLPLIQKAILNHYETLSWIVAFRVYHNTHVHITDDEKAVVYRRTSNPDYEAIDPIELLRYLDRFPDQPRLFGFQTYIAFCQWTRTIGDKYFATFPGVYLVNGVVIEKHYSEVMLLDFVYRLPPAIIQAQINGNNESAQALTADPGAITPLPRVESANPIRCGPHTCVCKYCSRTYIRYDDDLDSFPGPDPEPIRRRNSGPVEMQMQSDSFYETGPFRLHSKALLFDIKASRVYGTPGQPPETGRQNFRYIDFEPDPWKYDAHRFLLQKRKDLDDPNKARIRELHNSSDYESSLITTSARTRLEFLRETTNVEIDYRIQREMLKRVPIPKRPADMQMMKIANAISSSPVGEKAKDLLEHADVAIGKFEAVTDAAFHSINDAKQVIASEIINAKNDFSNLLIGVQNFLKANFGSVITNVIDASLLVVDFIRSCLEQSIVGFVTVIVRLLNRLGLTDYVVSKFIEWTGVFSSLPDPSTSGNEKEMQGISLNFNPLDVLVAASGTAVLGQMPKKTAIRDVTDYCRVYTSMKPVCHDLRDFLEYIPTLLPAALQKWIAWICPAYEWKTFLSGEFKEFHEACSQYSGIQGMTIAQTDTAAQLEIEKLWDQAQTWIPKVVNDSHISPKLNALLMKDMKLLDDLRDAINIANGIKGLRRTPYVICIYGPPGHGKSMMSYILAKMLAPPGTPDHRLVYMKNQTEQYWSGYLGQFCTCIDDAHAVVNDEFTRQLFSLIGMGPMLLDMPSLDNPRVGVKGTKFSSQLVILTTNSPFPSDNEIRNPDAIYRRRNVLVHLKVKSEFCDLAGRPDFTRIDQVARDNLSYLEWRFHKTRDPDANAWISGPMSSEAALKYIQADYNTHMNTQDTILRQMLNNPLIDRIQTDSAAAQMQMDGDDDYRSVADDEELQRLRAEAVVEETTVPPDAIEGYHQYLPDEPDIPVYAIRNEFRNQQKHADVCPQYKLYNNCHHHSAVLDRLTQRPIKTSLMAQIEARTAQLKDKKKWWKDVKAELNATTTSFFEQHPRIKLLLYFSAGLGSAAALIYLLKKAWYDKREKKPSKEEKRQVSRIVVVTEPHSAPWSCEYCGCDVAEIVHCDLHPDERLCDYYSCDDPCCIDPADGGRPCVASVKAYEATGIMPRHWTWYKEGGKEPQAAAGKGYQPSAERRAPRRAIRARPRPRPAEPQYFSDALDRNVPGLDVSVSRFIENAVFGQVGVISIPTLDRRITAYRLAGTWIVLPRHIFSQADGTWIPDHTEFKFLQPFNQPTFVFSFNSKNTRLFPDTVVTERGRTHTLPRDLVLYNLGPRINAAPNRIRHFALESAKPFAGLLVGCRFDVKTGMPYVHTQMLPRVDNNECVVSEMPFYFEKPGGKVYRVANGLHYSAFTERGDCGSLIISLDKSERYRIRGIHVAYDRPDGIGFAECIWQDEILDLLGKEFIVQGYIKEPPALDELPHTVYPKGEFTIYGKVPSDMQMRTPSETALERSPMYGLLGKPTHAPALLKAKVINGKFHSPLNAGIEKYGEQSRPLRDDYLEQIYPVLRDLWGRPSEKAFILSEKEAINGIPGYQYIDSIDMTSSPGLPYKLRAAGRKGKAWLFKGEFPDKEIADKELRQRLDTRILLASQGVRIMPSIWTDSLKDELRPLEKVRLGKTRVFTICNADFLIACRQYMGCFNADFYASHLVTPSAVGIDAESMKWHRMWLQLYSMSRTGFAGDFGRFDGTLAPQAMWLVGKLMNEYYKGTFQEDLIRLTLLEEMIHHHHQAMDCSFMTHGGNPSGNPITVIINTIVNYIYLAYAWLELAPPAMKSMVLFRQNVRPFIYGDDNIVAVNPEVESFYNMQSVSNCFARLGLEYLPPTKEKGDDFKVKPLDEFTFLCRANVQVPELQRGINFARIGYDTIQSLVDWYKPKDRLEPKDIVLEEHLECALRFLVTYGYQSFEHHRERFFEVFKRKFGRKPVLSTWQELTYQWNTFGCIGLEPSKEDEVISGVALFDGFIHQETAAMEMQMASPPAPLQLGSTAPTLALADAGSGGNNAGGVTGSDQVVSQKLGVINVEAQPTVVDNPTGASTASKSRATSMMPDKPWTLSDMVERAIPVETLTWTTSQTELTVLGSWNSPWDLLANHTMQLPFANYTFWRGTTVVSVKVNGFPQAQGRLVLFYTPFMQKKYEWQHTNRAAIDSIGHVAVDPALNKPAALVVPFTNLNLFINLAEPHEDMSFTGSFHLVVWSPLEVATGSPQQVAVTLYAHFTESEFHLPQILPPDTTRFSNIFAIHQRTQVERRTVVSERDQKKVLARRLLQEIREELGPDFEFLEAAEMQMGSSHSSQSNSAAQNQSATTATSDSHNSTETTTVGGNYTNIDVNMAGDPMGALQRVFQRTTQPEVTNTFGNWGGSQTGDSKATDSAGSGNALKASIPDMDKPNFGIILPPQQRMPVGYLSHANSNEYAQRMALVPAGTQHADHEHFGTKQDEMLFDYQLQKVTFISSNPDDCSTQSLITWDASQTASTLLWRDYIGPCTQYKSAIVSYDTQRLAYVDNASYWATLATFWTGDLVYDFEIIGNAYQTGRLVVSIHYGADQSTSDLAEATSQHVVYFDKTGDSNHFSIRVAYHAETQWKRILNMNNIPRVGTGPEYFNSGTEEFLWNRYFIGTISLRVMAPLAHADNVPNSVKICIRRGGADNFKIAQFVGNNWGATPAIMQMASHAETTHDQATMPQATTQTKSASFDPFKHFSERSVSARDVMKRYHPVGIFRSLDETLPSTYRAMMTGSYRRPEVDFLGSHKISDLLATGPIFWYGSCFGVWRGSVRVKILGIFNNISQNVESLNFYNPSEPRLLAMFHQDYRFGGNWLPVYSGASDFTTQGAQVVNCLARVDTFRNYFNPVTEFRGGSSADANPLATSAGTTMAPVNNVNTRPMSHTIVNGDSSYGDINVYINQTLSSWHTLRPMSGSVPIAYTDKYSQELTMEIPFISERECLFNLMAFDFQQFTSNVPEDRTSFENGAIVVGCIADHQYDMTVSNDQTWRRRAYQLFVSIGDDFRFGGYQGCHAVTFTALVNNSSISNRLSGLSDYSTTGLNDKQIHIPVFGDGFIRQYDL